MPLHNRAAGDESWLPGEDLTFFWKLRIAKGTGSDVGRGVGAAGHHKGGAKTSGIFCSTFEERSKVAQ